MSKGDAWSARAGVVLASLVLGLTPLPGRSQEAKSLQDQLAEQQAANEALRSRITKLEEVLKSDVCTNPEAEKLLEQERASPVPAGTAPATP